MIAETGLAALWLAATLAGVQLLLAWAVVARGNEDARRLIRPVAVAQGVLACLAMALLIILFLRSDMSVYLVAANSHSMKPFIYKFAGAWGNHEGSMLLWVAVMSASGAAVALFERALDRATHYATLGAQAAISLGFYAFLLLASNPFTRLDPPAVQGQGLNPLLQDPGLAFHPPTLYFGYVGLSVAFSFAVGALLTHQVNARFARAVRPWVLGAWVLLTFGITAGSYWAYYELGWGGWWFWDPVENASLMPWLAATALLHSASVLAARDALRAWTVMLSVVAFAMSMIGTFLVRSGILTSVHAFAVDPTRGSFILALLGLYIGGALVLFALRVHTVNEGARFEPVSRESALVVNNLLLCVILGLVLVGTLYPLLTEMMGVRVSVGPPYFNAVIGPVALLLMALLVVGPLLRWRRDDAGAVLRRALPAVGLGVLALIAAVALPSPTIDWLPTLGLGPGGRRWPRQPGTALETQPAAHAAFHLWHGDRASGVRGEPCRHGERKRLFRRAARRRQTGRPFRDRGPDRAVRQRDAGRRAELDRHGGHADGEPWQPGDRRRASAGPLLRRSAHTHQRIRADDALERPALPRARRAVGGRALAIAHLVEAVRHADLGRRRDDRAGRPARAYRPCPPRAQAGAGAGPGGAGMKKAMKRSLILWIPLGGYLIFLIVASLGLNREQQTVIQSRMIGKPVPVIDLPEASSSHPAFSTGDMADGKPRLLNIFASWCVPCAAEAPQLLQLAQRGVRIDAVAIRDARPDVDAFLKRHGDPFQRIGLDARSALQFHLGSSGVPETFVIDGKGIIRYQHIGYIGPQDMETILQKLKDAES